MQNQIDDLKQDITSEALYNIKVYILSLKGLDLAYLLNKHFNLNVGVENDEMLVNGEPIANDDFSDLVDEKLDEMDISSLFKFYRTIDTKGFRAFSKHTLKQLKVYPKDFLDIMLDILA